MVDKIPSIAKEESEKLAIHHRPFTAPIKGQTIDGESKADGSSIFHSVSKHNMKGPEKANTLSAQHAVK